MGNYLASQTAQLDFYLHDVPGVSYDRILGRGRFMKTLKCFNDEGPLVVKVFVKSSEDERAAIENYKLQLQQMKQAFTIYSIPHVLPYAELVHTDMGGYALRQYLGNNLYDRISTRPFLTQIDKLFITYQLLVSMERLHFYGLFHTDLKLENILVTSWDWIYLSDFAPYKPSHLREDNPADFDYFFDSSGARKCYIAPERFYTGPKPDLDESALSRMDMFSVGCVIAELWMDGNPLFTYSELIAYKKGNFDTKKIERIPNSAISELVLQLIDKNPQQRLSASAALSQFRKTACPSYFEFLHRYIDSLLRMDNTEIIRKIAEDFQILLNSLQETDNSESNSLAVSTRLTAILLEGAEDIEEHNDFDSQDLSQRVTRILEATHPLTNVNPSDHPGDNVDHLTSLGSIAASTTRLLAEKSNIPAIDITSLIKENWTHQEMPVKNGDESDMDSTCDSLSSPIPKVSTKEEVITSRETLSGPFDEGESDDVEHLSSDTDSEIDIKLDDVPINPPSQVFRWLWSWSVEDVCNWLTQHSELSSFLPAFRARLVDGKKLTMISDLKSLSKIAGPSLPLVGRVELLHSILNLKLPPVDRSHPLLEGFVLVLNLVISRMRSIFEPASLLTCLELFGQLAPYLSDEIRIDRLVPSIVHFIRFESTDVMTREESLTTTTRGNAFVSARAIEVLTATLALVKRIGHNDIHLFPEYIFPIMSHIVNSTAIQESPEILQIAFASSLPKLAEIAQTFLELGQFLKEYQSKRDHHGVVEKPDPKSYLSELSHLRSQVREFVEHLLSPESAIAVKSALIRDLSTLALFFGQDQTVHVLLPLVISCLNEHSGDTKSVLLSHLSGLCMVAGTAAVEAFIFPCLMPELGNENEIVVVRALDAIRALLKLKLLGPRSQRQAIERVCLLFPHSLALVALSLRDSNRLDRSYQVAPLLVHPNSWIRSSVCELIVTIAEAMDEVDRYCFILMQIQPFLTVSYLNLTSLQDLRRSLEAPISRRSFDRAVEVSFDDVSIESRPALSVERKATTSQPYENLLVRLPNTEGLAEVNAKLIGTSSPLAAARDSRRNLNHLSDIAFSLQIGQLDIPPHDEKMLYFARAFIRQCARRRSTEPKAPKVINFKKSELDTLIIHSIRGGPDSLSWLPNEQGEEWIEIVDTPSRKRLNSKLSLSRAKFSSPARLSNSFSSTTLSSSNSSLSIPRASFPEVRGQEVTQMAGGAALVARLLPKPRPELGGLFPVHSSNSSSNSWRPRGRLLAHIGYHRHAITKLIASPDSSFFASASEDGKVAIWDTIKLHKNISTTPQAVFRISKSPEAKSRPRITAMNVCAGSHSLVVGDSTGTIRVIRVEMERRRDPNGSWAPPSYAGTPVVNTLEIGSGPIVGVAHGDRDPQSLVVYATADGTLGGWDLRANKRAWKVEVEATLGALTSLALEPSSNWVVMGTNFGYVSGWDLRFLLPFRTFACPQPSPVRTVVLREERGKPTVLCAASPGLIQQWELDTLKCVRFFNSTYDADNRSISSPHHQQAPSGHREVISPVNPIYAALRAIEWSKSLQYSRELSLSSTKSYTSVRSILASPSGPIYSAGSDRVIRCWDLSVPENSLTIGANVAHRYQPQYRCVDVDGMDVFEETRGLTDTDSNSEGETLLTLSSLDGHHSPIHDLIQTEYPVPVLVSGDADGIIKIWQ